MISPGTFQMGCSPGDKDCASDEKPPHIVTLRKAFWMGQTETTQQAYRNVAGNNPSTKSQGDRLPVDSVTWDEAKHFCEAVGMRLPTEAEWEYAARAGTPGPRYGDVDAAAWFAKNSGAKPHEVGQKAANPFELYDMLGNVWEWVADWHGNYDDASQKDPLGPATGQYRVVRGGSWGSDTKGIRVSYRVKYAPTLRNISVGFRCAGEGL
jgi:formylglycine-generating enzyme required for sulfatase activity